MTNNTKHLFFKKANSVHTTAVRLSNSKEKRPKQVILEMEKKSKLQVLQR